MRKREIHSIAHWAMMFLLLMFPILMVGISTFGKESQTIDVTDGYQYESNEVNSLNDVVVGNIYQIKNADYSTITTNTVLCYGNYIYVSLTANTTNLTHYEDVYFVRLDLYGGSYKTIVIQNASQLGTSNYLTNFSANMSTSSSHFYHVVPLNLTDIYTYEFFELSTYLGDRVFDYTINNQDYKQEVNNWINAFIDLPINAWYKSLMNVIGVGFTNSTVMNVIYVMPVYILWVFIFDVIVDCFLVIIKLPHKLLNRLSGGENE